MPFLVARSLVRGGYRWAHNTTPACSGPSTARMTRGVSGFFAIGEIRVFNPDGESRAADSGGEVWDHADAQAASDRGVYLFTRYGWAEGDVSPVTPHAVLGVTWHGPMPARRTTSRAVHDVRGSLRRNRCRLRWRRDCSCYLLPYSTQSGDLRAARTAVHH